MTSHPALHDRKLVSISYKNHRGETQVRRVLPQRIWFGSTDWHPAEQWFMDAYDLDREAVRSFAMRAIDDFADDEGGHVSSRCADQGATV